MFKGMLGDDADSIEAQLEKDPKLINQLMGFWKQLDNMQESDQEGYREFIAKNKKEHEEEQKKINAEKEKLRIITGAPLCSLKIRVSKIWDQKKEANV